MIYPPSSAVFTRTDHSHAPSQVFRKLTDSEGYFILHPSDFILWAPVAESMRCCRLQLRGQWRILTAFP
jgi:hypothetical protein